MDGPGARRDLRGGAPLPKKSPGGSGKLIVIVLVLLGLGYGAWRYWLRGDASKSAASTAPAGAPMPGGSKIGAPPVPVVVATVSRQDLPIYADGLGTVQAFNTATVRVRVDALLQKVEFQEGQEVKAGDILARLDPEPFRIAVEQAEARKAQDAAQLANARIELHRNSELLGQKIVSQENYDSARALVDQLEATVKADQAALDNANVNLGYTTVTAPVTGRTGIRQVDQGNMVHTTDPNGLVVITQLQPIAVVFTLPQAALGEVQARMREGELPVLAVERDNRTPLAKGKLLVVDNQIDTTTGTIKLKAIFPNEDLRLWPGQFVNARLLLNTRKSAVVIASQVVQRGPDGTFAFVVNDENKVEIRPIQLGPGEEGAVVVESGLKPGDKVVMDGQYRLQVGSEVRVSDATRTDGTGKPGGGLGRNGKPPGGNPGGSISPRSTNSESRAARP